MGEKVPKIGGHPKHSPGNHKFRAVVPSEFLVGVSRWLTPTSDSLTHLPDPGEIGQVVPVIDFKLHSL